MVISSSSSMSKICNNVSLRSMILKTMLDSTVSSARAKKTNKMIDRRSRVIIARKTTTRVTTMIKRALMVDVVGR